MNLKTSTQRSETIREMIQDPDLDLTLKEAYSHIYHWLMWERAIRAVRKSHRSMKKHADILNANTEAYALRKQMKDL